MTRPSVLLIDHDQFLAHIHTRHFERAGWNVMYAANGEEGLEYARKGQPDVIILAIAMPKKDGFTTLHELKEDKTLAHIPVMMLSQLGTKEDIQHCLEHGACEYFIKTQYTPESLVQQATRYLRT